MKKLPIKSLEEFEAKCKEICTNINAIVIGKRFDGSAITINNWVTFDRTPRGDATPNIEYIYGKFYYVISERGLELKRIASEDPYEMLLISRAAAT